ncbi:glycosyltransferase family 9 protein [Caenispirillum bisanense]|uniref:glycosyltransferase family 9 protein n=1 Tax=Caenispirillum bisanense TaxID=414052 RepID=UPI0031DA0E5F
MTRRLLFITSNQIGDAVLSTGVLAHLLRQEPDLRVTVACGTVPQQLFAAVPNLDRLLVVRKRKRAGHWRELWRQTVGTRWWRIVDMRRSALPWLLWARHRQSVPKIDGLHRVQLAAAALGLQDDPPPPVIWTRPEDEAEAERLLPAAGGPVLGVGPTANWPGKSWPIDHWIDLTRRLTAADGPLPGARVAVFGAPNEREAAAALLAALDGQAVDLVGGPHLLTVAAALGRCRLYVGNDSGLMHMAAAAGAPTLGLFGPTDDRLYRPWSPRAAIVRTPESLEDWRRHMARPEFDVATTGSLLTSLEVATVEQAARRLFSDTAGAGV